MKSSIFIDRTIAFYIMFQIPVNIGLGLDCHLFVYTSHALGKHWQVPVTPVTFTANIKSTDCSIV